MPARTDATTDPDLQEELAVARLGTAFLRRWVDRLLDVELDEPTLLPGWSRRHLLAHVGYNARAVARLVTWAATDVETPMYSSPEARGQEIELGATQNAEALRNLVDHAAIDLDVRWRDLPDERWARRVVTAQGRDVPASETVWMRTREVWLHAVDLGNGARVDQVPAAVLARLVGDVHGAWSKRPDTAVPVLTARGADGAEHSWGVPGHGAPEVAGDLAVVAAWATGRLPVVRWSSDLTWVGGRPQAAPRWI